MSEIIFETFSLNFSDEFPVHVSSVDTALRCLTGQLTGTSAGEQEIDLWHYPSFLSPKLRKFGSTAALRRTSHVLMVVKDETRFDLFAFLHSFEE
jgi:hypothetical protein